MTSAEKYAAQWMPNGEVTLVDLIQAAVDEAQSVPVVGEPWRWIVNKSNGEPLLSLLTCDEVKRYLTDGFVVFPVYRQPTTSISAAELDALRKDAERYRKLRGWMSSKALEDWYRVTELSGVFCYVSWEAGDSFLDGLPECNVGLMQKDAALAQGKGE